MMLNVKILLDPKFYYQKLNELRAKSKQVFSAVGSDVKKVFSAVRSGVSRANVSFAKFARSALMGAGAVFVIEKAIQNVLSIFDAHMKNLKAQITDAIESMGDLASQYSSFDKQQVDQSNSNKNALSTLSDLQMSDSPLTNVQKEQQRQAIDTLRKSYHDLNVEIDAASGKIKNFRDIQSRVLSGDQKKELNNVRRQINALEKQNGIAAGAVQYKGGPFSEYWEKIKETYGWGAAQEAGGVQKQNVDKLMALRRREYQLTHSDRARDADAMYQAKMKDRAERLADPENVAAKRYTIDEQIRETETELKRNSSAQDKGRLQERLALLKNQRDDLPKTKKDAFTAAEKESLEIQKMINEGRSGEAKAVKLINEMKKQGISLTKEEAAEIIKARQKVASQTYYSGAIKDLENQIRIQQLINQEKTEEAERQRIIMELQKRGLVYDEASVNRNMELNRQLGSLNLRNSQKEEAHSLYTQSVRTTGRSKEAAEQSALRDAEKIKGGKLTDSEIEATKKLHNLTWEVQNMRAPEFGDYSIQSNDLTSRGGFSGGAVTPDSEKIALETCNYNKRQAETAEKIMRFLEELGRN